MSVRLLSLDFWGSKLVRFYAKIEHAPWQLVYFVNRQKLGLILENKMSENWSYQKM